MEKTKVFVIMPFTEEFFEVYEMIKTKFVENFVFIMPQRKEINRTSLKA